MSEYVRVAEFQADGESIDRFVAMIESETGPPPGVPATAINVLANRETGTLRVAIFFDSEDDLRQGSATLDGMSPPEDASMRRVAVDTFELLVSRQL